MLRIEVLERKNEITDSNGDKIMDLTSKSFEFKGDINVYRTLIVTDSFIMRPDLIAKIAYGNSNRLDYICKFNGVSNPFSLNTGKVLMIGDENDMKNQLANSKNTPDNKSKEDIRKRFFDPNKLSKKDQTRLKFLQQKSKQQVNGSQSNLPPNFAEPGSKELTVKNGQVIFGNDVVGNKENCPDPLSKARAKSKLIENKIFKGR